ncbi:MAG: methylthioribose-1-phosphate isomerase [Myxococcota bacterium]|jgi:methylthioribose-1-phosphate isomerase
MSWFTIQWDPEIEGGAVVMLDQRRLPCEEVYLTCLDVESVAVGITDMVIRGAPAIGIAAAMGVALAAKNAADTDDLDAVVAGAVARLADTRPTAVNLFWALDRMERVYRTVQQADVAAVRDRLLEEAIAIHTEDVAICRRIGEHGAHLVPRGGTVLTHCNAGALATAAWGTALSVIRVANEEGRLARVFADETRPYLQGARLTSWELHRDGIDVTVIADSAAGHFISRGEIDCVIVGSDRTVANGDVCNKIGTYALAVLCRENGIPFYAAVPVSTIDLTLSSGELIPIEERSADEVTQFTGTRVVPEGVKVRNPAFDVTPARLVTGIITERGIAYPPFAESLKAIVDG